MRTRIAYDAAVDAAKEHPRVYGVARRTRTALGSLLPPRRVEGVPGRIHLNDFMYVGNGSRPTRRHVGTSQAAENYRGGALKVIRFIERALGESGSSFDDIGSWLDFGCGYGRVIRFLTQRVPPDRVTASDVMPEAVRFCAAEFGVRPLLSSPRVEEIGLPTFDVIYAISVVTHVPPSVSTSLLARLGECVNPGGVLLFTTHGRRSIETIDRYGKRWVPLRESIARRVDAQGAAFEPYPYYSDDSYGMAWLAEAHVREEMERLHGGTLELLLHKPHGLDGHQDVWAYRRVA